MIPALTSIRLIFILIIFLFHCQVPYSQNMGTWGVSFFFILSGFILSLNYKEKIIKGVNNKEFYIKRISKIYPLHILVLTSYVVLSFIFNEHITNLFNWIIKLILNIFLLQSYIPIPTVYFSFNGSWFLSTIILAYLLFPHTIKFIHKHGYKSYVILLTVPLSMLIYSGDSAPYIFYINPFFRFFDFLFGMCLADIYTRTNKALSYQKATVLELSIFISSILAYIISINYNIGVSNYSLFYWIPSGAIILILSIGKGMVSKLLNNRLLIKGGNLSFAFFLFHPLLIHFFKLNEITTPIYRTGIIFVIAVLSFTLSYLTSRFYEPLFSKKAIK